MMGSWAVLKVNKSTPHVGSINDHLAQVGCHQFMQQQAQEQDESADDGWGLHGSFATGLYL